MIAGRIIIIDQNHNHYYQPNFHPVVVSRSLVFTIEEEEEIMGTPVAFH